VIDFGNSSQALNAMTALAAIGVAISSGEYLHQRHEFRSDGLFAWRLHRGRTSFGIRAIDRVVGRLMEEQVVVILLALRLTAAILLLLALVASLDAVASGTLAVILATTLLFHSRPGLGTEGSDQMSAVVLVAAALGRWFPSPHAVQLALAFVAAQVCLAYLSAGISKIAARPWRSGSAVVRIVSASMYGYEPTALLLQRHDWMSPAATCGVIATECLFPLVLVAPPATATVLFAAMFAFHVACAFVMGLNCFVWSFVSTYPAVLFVRAQTGR
jgi:hypothetical protein